MVCGNDCGVCVMGAGCCGRSGSDVAEAGRERAVFAVKHELFFVETDGDATMHGGMYLVSAMICVCYVQGTHRIEKHPQGETSPWTLLSCALHLGIHLPTP